MSGPSFRIFYFGALGRQHGCAQQPVCDVFSQSSNKCRLRPCNQFANIATTPDFVARVLVMLNAQTSCSGISNVGFRENFYCSFFISGLKRQASKPWKTHRSIHLAGFWLSHVTKIYNTNFKLAAPLQSNFLTGEKRPSFVPPFFARCVPVLADWFHFKECTRDEKKMHQFRLHKQHKLQAGFDFFFYVYTFLIILRWYSNIPYTKIFSTISLNVSYMCNNCDVFHNM